MTRICHTASAKSMFRHAEMMERSIEKATEAFAQARAKRLQTDRYLREWRIHCPIDLAGRRIPYPEYARRRARGERLVW